MYILNTQMLFDGYSYVMLIIDSLTSEVAMYATTISEMLDLLNRSCFGSAPERNMFPARKPRVLRPSKATTTNCKWTEIQPIFVYNS